MAYARFAMTARATITVPTFEHLLAIYRMHSGQADMLTESYRCEAKLTPAQLRKVPKELRAKLVQGGEGDSLAWLQTLFDLESGEAS